MTQSLRSIRKVLCWGEGDAEGEYVVSTIEGMGFTMKFTCLGPAVM